MNSSEIVLADESGSAHTSRTIILGDLQQLLSLQYPPTPIARPTGSPLLRRTSLVRRAMAPGEESYRYLRELYRFDLESELSSTMRAPWDRNPAGQPLLAMLCALERDLLLQTAYLADQLLNERIENLGAGLGMSEADGRHLVAGGHEPELLVEYLTPQREAHNRHRDRLAAVTYQPPEWITNTLGERPADRDRRVVWDAVVDRAIRYRAGHGIPDDALDLLEAEPPSRDLDKRVAWIAARRAIQGDLRLLRWHRIADEGAIGR